MRYGSQVCFPGFHQTDYPAPLRFSYRAVQARGAYEIHFYDGMTVAAAERGVCE